MNQQDTNDRPRQDSNDGPGYVGYVVILLLAGVVFLPVLHFLMPNDTMSLFTNISNDM